MNWIQVGRRILLTLEAQSVGAGWERGEVPANAKLQLAIVCAGGSVRGDKNIAVIVPQRYLIAPRRAQRREFNDQLICIFHQEGGLAIFNPACGHIPAEVKHFGADLPNRRGSVPPDVRADRNPAEETSGCCSAQRQNTQSMDPFQAAGWLSQKLCLPGFSKPDHLAQTFCAFHDVLVLGVLQVERFRLD